MLKRRKGTCRWLPFVILLILLCEFELTKAKGGGGRGGGGGGKSIGGKYRGSSGTYYNTHSYSNRGGGGGVYGIQAWQIVLMILGVMTTCTCIYCFCSICLDNEVPQEKDPEIQLGSESETNTESFALNRNEPS